MPSAISLMRVSMTFSIEVALLVPGPFGRRWMGSTGVRAGGLICRERYAAADEPGCPLRSGARVLVMRAVGVMLAAHARIELGKDAVRDLAVEPDVAGGV